MRKSTTITEQDMLNLGWHNSKSNYEIDRGIYSKRCEHMRYWLDLRNLDNVSLNFADDNDRRRYMMPRYKFTNRSLVDHISSIESLMKEFEICTPNQTV